MVSQTLKLGNQVLLLPVSRRGMEINQCRSPIVDKKIMDIDISVLDTQSMQSRQYRLTQRKIVRRCMPSINNLFYDETNDPAMLAYMTQKLGPN